MSVLSVLVDYDNISERFKSMDVLKAAQEISRLIPISVFGQYDSVQVRLYGGWRQRGTLTTAAQRMLPIIRDGSPRPLVRGAGPDQITVRLEVILADKPVWTDRTFAETFVKDRPARKFRARTFPWSGCMETNACGMSHLRHLKHSDSCQKPECDVLAQSLIVRDEQKMVDTLIVADMAYLALQRRDKNIVVVSSDTDMWPGVLLAANAGCLVTHVHTVDGWKTQRHLCQMLEPGKSETFYDQVSP